MSMYRSLYSDPCFFRMTPAMYFLGLLFPCVSTASAERLIQYLRRLERVSTSRRSPIPTSVTSRYSSLKTGSVCILYLQRAQLRPAIVCRMPYGSGVTTLGTSHPGCHPQV